MSAALVFVKLLDQDHAVTLPPFAEREEIAVAHTRALRGNGGTLPRASAAAIGLCTRIGRLSGVDYAACGCDPLVYGGRVYGWLREKGATLDDILIAGRVVVEQVNAALYPRKAEVDAQVGFSDPRGAGPT